MSLAQADYWLLIFQQIGVCLATLFGSSYLQEDLRQIRSYLPEDLQQIRSYFPEDLRLIRGYLPEYLGQIRTDFWDLFLSYTVVNGPVQSYLVFSYPVWYCTVLQGRFK